MRKIIAVALIMLGIGILGTAVTAGTTDIFSFDTVNFNQEEVVNGEQVKNIDVKLSSTDVILMPSESDEIRIFLNGEVSERIKDNYNLIVKDEGDFLHITVDVKNMYFFIGTAINNLTLEVYVPERIYENITVTSSSGDIRLIDSSAAQIDLEASSGDIIVSNISTESTFKMETSSGTIEAQNVKSESFDLKASSGDILLEQLNGNIKSETSSGNIEINNQKVNGNITATASSGDVLLSFMEEPTSVSIDFKGKSGNGQINLKDVNYTEKSEDVIKGLVGNGDYAIKVDTSSGDFKLN